MSYNPNHHYNRREPNPGLPNQPHRSNSNVYNNAEVDVSLTHPAHSYNSSDVRSGRAMEASEFGNTAAFTHSISQQQSSYRPNVSSMNYQPSNAGGNARSIDSYNPSFQNPKFAPQNQNSVDSLHSLKQTLAHTLQNLNNSSAASAYAQPETVYRPLQGQIDSATSMTRNAYNAPHQAQDRYNYEQAAESSFQRSMAPPAYVHSTHQSSISSNRFAQSTPGDVYHGSKFVDTRISAAVAPVPGDVRYQSTQQAHSAHHINGIPHPYNASVPNRAVADGNNQSFAPTQVPRVEHSCAQPQLGASAYYNRRPDSAPLTAPKQQMDMNIQSFHPNRGSLNPREMIGAGGAGNVTGQVFDQHSYSRPTSISVAAAAVSGIDTGRGSVGYHAGDNRMDSRMDNRMNSHRADIRDVSPHSSYRPSLDRNPSQYAPDSYSSMHAPHATAASAHARINPLSTLVPSSRPSKWSAELVDPLDIYDKLLHNSLCIYEEPSANVSTHASLGKHSISRDDRNITTTTITTNLPTSNRYSNNTMSPANASRKRSISPSNSVASRDNYYSGGDRYTHSHNSTERSTRPRGGDFRDSNEGRNRYESQDNRRSRRSRSPSRSHSSGRGSGRSYHSYPTRNTDRTVSSGTALDTTVRRPAAATVPTSRNLTCSVSDKPDYALCTPSQIYTTYRTPTVSLNYTQYPTILHVQDLCVKYPRLYVPNDFLHVTVDAESMLTAVSSGTMSKLALPVPLQVECPNPVLHSTSTMTPDASTNSMLEAPKYTTVDALSANSTLVMPSSFNGSEDRFLSACEARATVNRFSSRALPVKFQVRVLVCCGVEDPNSLDPNKPLEEQLRVLCGQRKSGMTLLGCPWEQHLDTDPSHDDGTQRDTPLTNRSCLVRTVQRALFAQALLRIPVETTVDNDTGDIHYSSPGLISLCEVNYLRPAEVEDGVTYEEQAEVTTIFLYTLQPLLLQSTAPAAEPYNSTELYSARVTGASVGPTINENVDMCDKKMLRLLAESENAPVASADASVEEAVSAAAASDVIVSESATSEVQPSATIDLAQVNADASAIAPVPDSVEALLSSLVDSEVSTNHVTAGVTAVTAVGSTVESAVPEDKTDESAVIAQSSIPSIPAEHVEVKKQLSLVIPSEPTLLLCPMPAPSGVLNDKKASRDVVGLKMGTLTELSLGYSQTDRTERVFELALAGELTMCLLATNCANTVTDFVLAGHPVLRRDVDAKVTSVYDKFHTVKTKDEEEVMLNTANHLVATSAATVADEATAGSDAAVDASTALVAEVVNGIVAALCGSADKVSIEESEDSAAGSSFFIDKTPGQQVEDVVKVEPVVEDDSMQVEAGLSVSAGEDSSSAVEVGADDETRDLKRRFLSAARWFDVNGEKCLHLEHLKMILHSSTRVLSPGAVKDAVKRVCENDLFQYEGYL